MNPRLPTLLVPVLVSVLLTGASISGRESSPPAPWPQFRGPGGRGVPETETPLPEKLSPDRGVVWKQAVPLGHGSPVVAAGKIFLTAVEGERLLTLALDRETGNELWRLEAPHDELESKHRIGSHAQSTCATDGRHVVSFFGSSGLHVATVEGEPVWSRRMGPFKNGFGSGSSPIVHEGRVILNQDHDTDSFLLVLDLETGEPVWRRDRSEFPRGYATPVIWKVGDRTQVVVAGTLRIVAHDLENGEPIWQVRGIARLVNTTPVLAPGGDTLYYAGWSPGADPGDRIETEPFDTLLSRQDTGGNGKLEKEEFPEGSPLWRRFNQVDRDKSGSITREEYDSMRTIFDAAQNVALAIRAGGRGDITDTHVSWTSSRFLPYVPSPLVYRGAIHLVKNGGIVSTLDPKTGKSLKVGRISARGDYYASPVGGDGKVYLASEKGEVCVLRAGPRWEQLSCSDFGERIYATPAIVDGRIFLRTEGHLFCLREPGS